MSRYCENALPASFCAARRYSEKTRQDISEWAYSARKLQTLHHLQQIGYLKASA